MEHIVGLISVYFFRLVSKLALKSLRKVTRVSGLHIYSGNIHTFVLSTLLWLLTDWVSSSPSLEVGSLCHYSNIASGTVALYEPWR